MDHSYNRIRKHNSNKICSVPFCQNRASGKISLHKFPTNGTFKNLWAAAFKMEKRIPKNAYACSSHFTSFDFMPTSIAHPPMRRRLKKCAVPSLKLPLRPSDRRYLPPIAEEPPETLETPTKETLKDVKPLKGSITLKDIKTLQDIKSLKGGLTLKDIKTLKENKKSKVPRSTTRRRTVLQERVLFNKRVQKEGERVEVFIEELFKLAKWCNYGEFEEEMIRDRMIIGLQNQSLSNALQHEPDLTLEKAILKIVQNEEANKQILVVKKCCVAISPVKKKITAESGKV